MNFDVEISASLGDALGKLHGGIDDLVRQLKVQERIERLYQQQSPLFCPLQGSVVVPASGANAVIDLGGPSAKRQWEVRQLVVGGCTWATAAGGAAEIYVGATEGIVSNLAAMQDHAAAMPAVAFYSAAQFRVVFPNRVYLVIVGGTASQQYVAGGDAIDLPDAIEQTVFSG